MPHNESAFGVSELRATLDLEAASALSVTCRYAHLISPPVDILCASLGAPQRSQFDASVVVLTWSATDVAIIELDDPSTFNAMTPHLMIGLASRLTEVLASSSVRGVVLQATGPHFCTGERHEKKAADNPQWWTKA